MKHLNSRIVQALLYIFSFANVIACVIASGYVLLKDEDKNNRRTAIVALALCALFVVVFAIIELFYNTYINLASGDYEVYSRTVAIVNILQIIIYAVFVILALCGVTLSSQENAGQKTNNENNNNDVKEQNDKNE